MTPSPSPGTPVPAIRPDGAVVRPRPVEAPAMRLFLLHHAGGSHLAYREWAGHLPADWELCLIEAPGRGRLHRLPPHPAVGGLARWAADAVEPLSDRPFGIFGHSLGAMAAYELTRLLQAEGRALPRWLGISAVRPPHAGPEAVHYRSHLPDDALKEELARIGGTPREVLDEPSLWGLFEPLLRNDFAAAEHWQPDTGLPPLPVPLSVYGGAGDPAVTVKSLVGWERWTTRWLGLRLFPGGHFYFQKAVTEVVGQIVKDLADARPV
ncbi:thioesterase II family protein [Streptomyces platensis]|uniref:thioesterase II family protein n=1 Tax=Streptomyces platensis TaxID=58346 RepID=UPI0037A09E3E